MFIRLYYVLHSFLSYCSLSKIHLIEKSSLTCLDTSNIFLIGKSFMFISPFSLLTNLILFNKFFFFFKFSNTDVVYQKKNAVKTLYKAKINLRSFRSYQILLFIPERLILLRLINKPITLFECLFLSAFYSNELLGLTSASSAEISFLKLENGLILCIG